MGEGNYSKFSVFFIELFIDTRHTANKMEDINVKSVVGDSLQLESSRSQANSPDPTANKQPADMNKVGQSVFYDCLELSPTAEKQDFMKPEQSDTDEESKFQLIEFFPSNLVCATFNFISNGYKLSFQCRILIKTALNLLASHISVLRKSTLLNRKTKY